VLLVTGNHFMYQKPVPNFCGVWGKAKLFKNSYSSTTTKMVPKNECAYGE